MVTLSGDLRSVVDHRAAAQAYHAACAGDGLGPMRDNDAADVKRAYRRIYRPFQPDIEGTGGLIHD